MCNQKESKKDTYLLGISNEFASVLIGLFCTSDTCVSILKTLQNLISIVIRPNDRHDVVSYISSTH